METAPRDGTPVLLKYKTDIELKKYNKEIHEKHRIFIGWNTGDLCEWGFLGTGGIPDAWLEGWAQIEIAEKIEGEQKYFIGDEFTICCTYRYGQITKFIDEKFKVVLVRKTKQGFEYGLELTNEQSSEYLNYKEVELDVIKERGAK